MIKNFDGFLNEETKNLGKKDTKSQLKELIYEVLKPGTDKGSTQGVIDTKDNYS